MSFENKLIIDKIRLEKDKIESFKIYPFNIEVVKNFDQIVLDTPVTFFVGENGVGKSTFMEAIAVKLGMPAEGGTDNFRYETNNTTSILSEYLDINIINKPKTKFFLRAESFYNFSTEVDNIGVQKSYGGSLHTCSHGESFLQLIENRFTPKGLYILDEPEAALSPQRQLSLLYLIDKLVKDGSQFIISTHSPIIVSYRDGKILDLNNDFKEIKYEETDIYSLYKMYLENPLNMQHRLFDE